MPAVKQQVAIFLLDANVPAHQRLNKHFAQRDDGCQTLQSTAGNLLEHPGHACIVLGICLDEVDDGRRVKTQSGNAVERIMQFHHGR